MNVNKVLKIFDLIKQALPSEYPRPKIVFFEDEFSMLNNIGMEQDKKELVFALYIIKTKLICFCNNILNLSNIDIAKILLHEIGHAYAHLKYGEESEQFKDEIACDQFASRWIKKINIPLDNKRFLGWKKNEIEILKKLYPTTKKQIILKKINRTWPAIRNKARQLNIKRKI